ncbi:hypothetical protein N8I77_012374 [Diaporthe amygdali]|uniref:Uncharacterized protein n=1 Tax=Phomopsis amygdali TaxID=1214568 RepID=A0AAD9S2M9_PHOAM|nr:hypothetical protein N8I77_012374 [Diaporthe amygdali]
MADFSGGSNVPIESARRNADRLGINYDALPQMPFWSRLFGSSDDYVKTRVATKVMASSASVGRELTQSEKDAMAYHFSKLLVTISYASPLAVGATYAFEKATRSKFGFPFYNPKPPRFNPNKFPGVPEGMISTWTWHGVRVLAWYTVSKVSIGLLATSYAISVYSANAGSDNRLESYRRELSRRAGVPMRGGQQPALPQEPSGQPRRQLSQPRWEEPEPAPESAGWAGSEQPEKAAPMSTTTQWTATQKPQTERQDSYNQESYIFDDASPVAASEQNNPPTQQSTQQGGSAWDRIRGQAQAARGQPGSWAKKRQDEMTSRGAQDGTSYNYTTADEEKSYAKEQAQKEFDEMLERERRGKGR